MFYTNSHSRVFINLKITFIIPNLDQLRRMHSLLSKHNRVVENREFELNERLKESENGVHKTILDLRELELYRVEEKFPSFYLESLRNVSQWADSRLGLGISTSFYSSRMRSDDARKISSRPIKLIIETSNTPTYRIVSRRFRAKIRFHEENVCFARKPIYLNAVIIDKSRDLKKKKNFIATFMNSLIIFFFWYLYIYTLFFLIFKKAIF